MPLVRVWPTRPGCEQSDLVLREGEEVLTDCLASQEHDRGTARPIQYLVALRAFPSLSPPRKQRLASPLPFTRPSRVRDGSESGGTFLDTLAPDGLLSARLGLGGRPGVTNRSRVYDAVGWTSRVFKR